MRSFRLKHQMLTCAIVVFCSGVGAWGTRSAIDNKSAFESTPQVPPVIRSLLQSKDYDKAISALDKAIESHKGDAGFLVFLKGQAQHFSGKYQDAIATFRQLELKDGTKWKRQARFARALAILKTGDYQAAEEIYETEVRFLLSTERKHEIAVIYLEFANTYYRTSTTKTGAVKQPDYQKALTFFGQALQVGVAPKQKLLVEFRIARCRQHLNDHNGAIAGFSSLIKNHPQSSLAIEMRYQLAMSLRAANQLPTARKTLQNLIRDFPNGVEGQITDSPTKPGAITQIEAKERIALASYTIAHTYGVPAPNSIDDMELGIAAAKRFISAYPDHRLAAQAHYEISVAYLAHNRFDDAVNSLQKLIAEPQYTGSATLPIARFQLGSAFLRQKKFDEAIASWKDYLARHPSHSSWAGAQKAIVDTEYMAAFESRQTKDYENAIKLWTLFLNNYPLDARSPQIMLEFGLIRLEQEQYDAAIASLERLVSKYPKTEHSSQAQYLIASIYEQHLNQFAKALEAYRSLTWGSWANRAKLRISQLTHQEINVVTERVFRTNQTPRLKITTRNVREITIKAYSIDLETYFRKMHLASGIEHLDVALIDPDKTFIHKVENYADYKQFVNHVEVPLETPGVMAVTVSVEPIPLKEKGKYSHIKLRPQETTTMVLRSDIDILVKSSRDELFVFAENMRTGKPAPGVKLLVSDGSSVFSEIVTGDDGVFISRPKDEKDKTWAPLKSSQDIRVFAIEGEHVASNVVGIKGIKAAQSITSRGFIYSDRPVYRPGQLVNMRGIVRWVEADNYTYEEGQKFKLTVFDPRGRTLRKETVALNSFGSFATRMVLPSGSPQGEYRIQLSDPSRPGKHNYQGTFTVREFKLQPIHIDIATKRKVYYRGETVTGTIKLTYYYGAPVVDKEITYVLADNISRSGHTNASGEIEFSLETRDFREDQLLTVSASYSERNIATAQNLFLSTRGFVASIDSARDVYVSGETFGLTLTTKDAAGENVGKKLQVSIVKQTEVRGELGERTIRELPVITDETTGIGHTTVKIGDAGTYVLRVTGEDRFGNPISAQKNIVISGSDDTTRLRILADKHNLRTGGTSTVTLHWRNKPALAVVTFQGAQVLEHRIVELKTGTNPIKIEVSEKLAPNFDLVVSVMSDSGGRTAKELILNEFDLPSFHEASSPFEVERPLNVTVQLDRDQAQPGELVTATITTTDPQGNPVESELSLAMIDKSLLTMFPGLQSQITDFFGGVRRSSAMRTATSCTFKYSPRVEQIDSALIAEAIALEMERADELARRASGGIAIRALSDQASQEAAPPSRSGGSLGGGGNRAGRYAPGQMGGRGGAGALSWQRGELKSEVAKPQSKDHYMFRAESGSLPRTGTAFSIQDPQASQSYGQIEGEPRIQARFKAWSILDDDNDGSVAAIGDYDLFIKSDSTATVIPQFMTQETGYWNPALVTDKNGKLTLELTMPARSTSWELLAQGITRGTLTGSAKTNLVTRKKLFGELKLPLAYVDGDQASIPVAVHNNVLAKGKIAVTLTSTVNGSKLEETKVIEVSAVGIHETHFDRAMAGTGDAAFELLVVAQPEDGVAIRDHLTQTIPVNPMGIPVYSTAGGTATGPITNWISPPRDMTIQNPRLQLRVGGSVQRTFLDAVLGGSSRQTLMNEIECTVWSSTLERTSSDILASVGLMNWSQKRKEKDSPEMEDLTEHIRSAVSYLVSNQNDDGGWTWTGAKGSSDRGSSARALWALTLANKNGFDVPTDSIAKGTTFVQTQFAQVSTDDYSNKAALLHALTQAGRGDFAYANRLYRSRQNLDHTALAYLAVTFADMKRLEIAKELLNLLSSKAGAAENSTVPPEIHALMLLALNKAAPNSPESQRAVSELLGSRVGSRWAPDKATGPALLALSDYYSRVQHKDNKFKLSVFVNNEKVADLDMTGTDSDKVIDVPEQLLRRGEPVAKQTDPAARKQRIHFELTGRGEFTYSAILVGSVNPSKAKSTTSDWRITRYYEPAPIELDGKELPRGFGILTGRFQTWRNNVTELPKGKRALVELQLQRNSQQPSDQELQYLVITEPLPSGTEVLRNSISGPFDRYEIHPGFITFYVGNRRTIGSIRYQVVGVTEGKFKAGPTIVRNFYAPDEMVIAATKSLQVVPAGTASKDPYRLSPVELHELGKRLMVKKDFQEASKHLSNLFKFSTLKPDIMHETVSNLFKISVELEQPQNIVRFFEIIKEKYPDQEIAFDQIVKVGGAYRAINEYERSFLVFRATAEGSFMRESQVAGFLREQGEYERSVAVMDRLIQEYPPEPYVAAASYALAQDVFAMADSARQDTKLIERGITRSSLLNNAIERLDLFLTAWPEDPAGDQASFSLASGLVELEEWDEAIARCSDYAARFTDSEYLDSFWYIIGYGHFAKGNHKQALDMCKRVAEHTRKDDETGQVRESQNKYRSIYIMGQVQHSRGNPAAAIEHYELVSNEFPDAREAVQYFTRKAISLPEITTIKPGQPAVNELSFRNIAQCEIKVYRIDLMKFSLLQRNLANITRINLSGIRPLQQQVIALGDGTDYRDRKQKLTLDIKDEGAYLVVCRGENLHTSGLVLVTPLELDVQEDKASGRVRTIVKNTMDSSYAPNVHVKVIGSRNSTFQEGTTDLRGIFISDNIQGQSTVIARAEDGQYAFHRGEIELGQPAAPQQEAKAAEKEGRGPGKGKAAPGLLDDLFDSNKAIQQEQLKNLRKFYKNEQKGIEANQAF